MKVTKRLGECFVVFVALALALSSFIGQGLGQELNNKARAASPDDDDQIFLPMVMRPTNLIYGHVTDNGAAATDIPLELWQDNGSTSSIVMMTYTDTNGDYRFQDMIALGAGESYWVSYMNYGDPARLHSWHTRELTSFPDGSSVNLGNFDVADVGLISPEGGGESVPPFTFQWALRPATPSDSYQLNIYNWENRSFSTAPLGYTVSYSLNGLPAGMQYCNPYFWEIRVNNPDGGYGLSYGFGQFFLHQVALSGIHGCVTEDGAPVSGVTVELYRDSNGNYEILGTTTTSNGYFDFTSQPSLTDGESYFVSYSNYSNADRLSYYTTRDLTSYTVGSAAFISDFDIRNITIYLPGEGVVTPLPTTFDWDVRPNTPWDDYEFDLYDPDDYDPYFYTVPSLGYQGGYSLAELPPGFSPGVWYAWDLWVYDPWGGYGVSYESRSVSFSSLGMNAAQDETPEHTRLDYQRVRARQNSRMSQAQPRRLLNREADRP